MRRFAVAVAPFGASKPVKRCSCAKAGVTDARQRAAETVADTIFLIIPPFIRGPDLGDETHSMNCVVSDPVLIGFGLISWARRRRRRPRSIRRACRPRRRRPPRR